MDQRAVETGLKQRITDWSADTVTITPPTTGGTGRSVVWRKLKASLTISLVWGAFCGTAMTIGRSIFFLSPFPHRGSMFVLGRGLVVEFLLFTAIGTVFGLLFTTALALSRSRSDDAQLSASRSAAAGAVAGVIFGAGTILLTAGFRLIPTLIAATTFGLLGAGIGAAMVNSARRGARR